MDNMHKRYLLFLVGCMGTRLLLAYLAKIASPTVLFYMGILALLPAIGFMYLFFSGTRKTGPEVFGDKIWWNKLRPVHSLLYFLFAYFAIAGYKNAWMFLLIDVIVGFTSFSIYHH